MQACSDGATTGESEVVTRRSLLTAGIYSIWGFIVAALAAPASAYLLLAPAARKGDEWIDIGDVSTVPAGQPVEIAFRRNRVDGWKVASEKLTTWVVKGEDNSVVAFQPQCTHLGCAYHWDENTTKFVCPCHNSLFSIEGRVLAGPAPRPLDRFEVKVEGNKLLLGKLRQQSETRA